jgi:hypothetical protein
MEHVLPGELLELDWPIIRTDFVSVTPKLADKWLGSQTRNRSVNRPAVLGYRRDMLDGRWTFTGEPIQFDIEGRLINGQHRLTALSLLDGQIDTITFLVVRGLPPEAQLSMDQGRRRSSGQQLQLTGFKNATAMSSGIRLYMLWNTERLFTRKWDDAVNISTASILAFAQANPELIEHANSKYGVIRDAGLRHSSGMAFVLKLGLDNAETVNLFFDELHALVNQPEGSALLALNRRLTRARLEGLKLSDVDQLAFLVRTWNHWINGTRAGKLQRPKGGEWNDENFPKVEGV